MTQSTIIRVLARFVLVPVAK